MPWSASTWLLSQFPTLAAGTGASPAVSLTAFPVTGELLCCTQFRLPSLGVAGWGAAVRWDSTEATVPALQKAFPAVSPGQPGSHVEEQLAG